MAAMIGADDDALGRRPTDGVSARAVQDTLRSAHEGSVIVRLYIGTQYQDWRGVFYPEDLPQRRWLAYYAERFGTVEVNNSFYRLPERATFERWGDLAWDLVCRGRIPRVRNRW
jgi:hypothetical protein